jgi:hypothetical protein
MKQPIAPKFIGVVALLGGLLGYGESGFAANFVGDGRDDLVIGAPGEAIGVGPRSGAAYLYRGYSYGVSATEVIDQGGLEINELGDEFGSAFAAGDFDGDGEDDLAIGAPGEAIGPGPMAGAVFVYTGTGGGLRATAWLDQTNLGLDEYGDRFGATLVAGDFNDDGFDDLAVGAPGERYGAALPAGAVYVFYGSKLGLLPIQTIDQTGLGANEAGDMFGTALSAGDYDGDGWTDLAVGAPGEAPGPEPRSGLVFVYRGGIAGLEPDLVLDQTELGANEEGDLFGWALTSGDFNDDGLHDLAVGAPGESPGSDPKSGAVFVFRGTTNSLEARQFLSQAPLDHNEIGDEFGWALTSGDFNGDGRDDLAVGAPGENLDAAPDTGVAYIFRGDPTNFVPLQLVTQSGMGADETDDRFGSALASGNYLGDERIDLAIGAPGESRGSEGPSGSVYLLRGIPLGLSAARSVDQSQLGTDEYGDMFGAAICE